MTKSQEIQILRETVERLGPQSYCGPWLAEQIQFIEADIRSDLSPVPCWQKSRARLDQEWADMVSRCQRQEQAVSAKLDRATAEAKSRADYTLAAARKFLLDCADKLER